MIEWEKDFSVVHNYHHFSFTVTIYLSLNAVLHHSINLTAHFMTLAVPLTITYLSSSARKTSMLERYLSPPPDNDPQKHHDHRPLRSYSYAWLVGWRGCHYTSHCISQAAPQGAQIFEAKRSSLLDLRALTRGSPTPDDKLTTMCRALHERTTTVVRWV